MSRECNVAPTCCFHFTVVPHRIAIFDGRFDKIRCHALNPRAPIAVAVAPSSHSSHGALAVSTSLSLSSSTSDLIKTQIQSGSGPAHLRSKTSSIIPHYPLVDANDQGIDDAEDMGRSAPSKSPTVPLPHSHR